MYAAEMVALSSQVRQQPGEFPCGQGRQLGNHLGSRDIGDDQCFATRSGQAGHQPQVSGCERCLRVVELAVVPAERVRSRLEDLAQEAGRRHAIEPARQDQSGAECGP